MFETETLADGRRRVVRNGHLPERQILTGIGAVDLPGQAPRAALVDEGRAPRAPRSRRYCADPSSCAAQSAFARAMT